MGKNGIQVAVYYFPNYHVDPRNEAVHGRGWSEWELMKCARPRFPGHRQPKTPLWGYEDESDPAVMAKKIRTAAAHGIDAFVFDWYWYDGPFLERALEEGFLNAPNCGDLRFALMWANHDWRNCHPGGRGDHPVLYPWNSTADNVGEVWDYVIENFLTRPNYWRVGGKPYFSIYQFQKFLLRMGGPEGAKAVLDDFRSRAVRAGLPGVHICGIWYDILEEKEPQYEICHQREWAEKIGIDSYTSYNNLCLFRAAKGFPFIDAGRAISDYAVSCTRARKLPAPYFPVITAGWDSSPRAIQSEIYEDNLDYPYLPVMEVLPDQLDQAIRSLMPHLESYPEGQRILFFNAWNEWTEGSYLEPDTDRGFTLLEAIKKHFA